MVLGLVDEVTRTGARRSALAANSPGIPHAW